jgi:chemotaxis protein CheY-P-specific phosphatase CheC
MQSLILLTTLALTNNAPIAKDVNANELAKLVSEQMNDVRAEVNFKTKISAANTFLFQAKQALRLARTESSDKMTINALGE